MLVCAGETGGVGCHGGRALVRYLYRFGLRCGVCVLLLCPTNAHDAPRFALGLWVVTTAMMVQKSKSGRIRALVYSSYSYWFRNYGCTGGFCVGSSGFMELYWRTFRNLVTLG